MTMVRESLTLRCFSLILLQVGPIKNISVQIYKVYSGLYKEVVTQNGHVISALSSCARSQPTQEGGDGLCFFQIPTRGPLWVNANAEKPGHPEISVSHIAYLFFHREKPFLFV